MPSEAYLAIFIAGLPGLFSLIASVISMVSSKKEKEAGTREKEVGAFSTLQGVSLKLLNETQEDRDKFRAENIKLRNERRELRECCEILVGQIKELGYEPACIANGNIRKTDK